MTKHRIVQFAPDSKNPNAPGTYGWGFDVNGFRIVMYAPAKFDHVTTKVLQSKLPAQSPEDEASYGFTKKNRNRKVDRPRSVKNLAISRGMEHGPAHIHVIEKKSGKECRMELVENSSSNHFVQLLDSDKNRKNRLSDKQIEEASAILGRYAPEFIQLWREFYQDTKLGSYVTRISEKFSHNIERNVYDSNDIRYIQITDGNGATAQMTLEDYLLIEPHHKQR